jgi:hypothetical protein
MEQAIPTGLSLPVALKLAMIVYHCRIVASIGGDSEPVVIVVGTFF